MSAFDGAVTDVKDQVARLKHLRVERLVKLQTKKCGVCLQPVVYAVASSASGKRLPFDPSALLNNAQKVVIASDESLEVWPFAPRKHICDPAILQVQADEHDRRCTEEVARLKARGRVLRSGISPSALNGYEPPDAPPYGTSWGDRP